jgi:hypothetical protein
MDRYTDPTDAARVRRNAADALEASQGLDSNRLLGYLCADYTDAVVAMADAMRRADVRKV